MEIHASRPRRRHIARRARDLLREDVLSGRWIPGPLPSEDALAASLSVSRNVVREALAMLVGEGLLDRVPGAGTFVISRKAIHRFDMLRALGEDAAEDTAVRRRIITLETVPAAEQVAASLGVRAGDPVLLLERLTLVRETPTALWTTYLPHHLAKPLLDRDPPPAENAYQLVESLGLRLGSSEVQTEAVAADPAVAELLEVPTGWPLLLLRRTLRLVDGAAVDVGTGYMRGDQVVLTSHLSRARS
ncbi:GntR family transcriptional regulator [Saccharopolyspora sp. 5N708]|uniref:GntR family transcriptional regulator n=1 Tax=Saccharopolyspora sp. 5N708 TaxID=3457424 RepID=UPI003FD5CC84